MVLRKIVSFIATAAVIFNSLASPLAVLAQEVTPVPDPTPVDTSTPVPSDQPVIAPTDSASPTVSPDVIPIDLTTPSPEITPTPTDLVTPIPTDTPIATQAPESNPTVQGPPASDQPTVTPTVEPTFTTVQPEKEGSLTTTVVDNIDLSTINLLNSNVDVPTVTTDKPDYSPTSVVLITGTGFTAGKTYTLVISSTDLPPVTFTDSVTADPSGSFSYAYQLDGNYRPNYKVEVKDASFVVAGTTFTDSTAGANNAGAGADNSAVGTATWTNQGNITAVGSPYANASVPSGATTHYLQGSNYSFSIPGGATINGITVVINRRANSTNSVDDSSVRLLKAGVLVGSNLASGAGWSKDSFATQTYGGISNLWGTTWTPADINSANFGVALSAVSGSSQTRTLDVDYMQITVTYTEAATPTPTPTATPTYTPTRICHATGSEENPYVSNTPANSGVLLGHVGLGHQNGMDIIPPIPGYVDAGQNWDTTHIAIYNNDCNLPPATGTLKIVKNTVGGNGTFNFTVSGPTASTPQLITSGGTANTSLTVNPGTYSVTESAAAGWTTSYSNCSSVSVSAGNTTTCTVTNTKKPTLAIYKVCNPTGDTGTFNLQIDGNNVTTGTVCGGWTNGQIEVSVGQHTVSESGGNLSNYTSAITGDCASNGTITLAAGDVKSCTITNTRNQGRVTFQKVVDDNSSVAGWTFSANGHTYHSGDSDSLNTGTYTVTESGSSDYTPFSVGGICSSLNGSSATLTVTTNGGTCTFTNHVKRGNVVVTKYLDKNANGTQDEGENGLQNWTIALSGNGTQSTNVSGVATFSNIFPGSPTLSETMPDGTWTQSNISCDNGTYNSELKNFALSVAAGQTVNCKIGNYQKSHITVTKDVIDPDGKAINDQSTGFVFGMTGQDPFTLYDGGSKSFDVKPGSFHITETENTDYDFKGCTNLNTDGYISTTSGQEVTVKCTNQQRLAHITVIKHVVGTDGETDVTDTTGEFVFGAASQSATLKDDGSATFDVNPGNYDVTEANNSDYGFVSCNADYEGESIGTPLTDLHGENVTLGSNDSVTVTCINKQLPGSISGAKWNDLNDNGQRDTLGDESQEPGIAGWTVFIDENGNGVLDGKEVSTQTDSDGNYTFPELVPGSYRICEAPQDGWFQTYPQDSEINNCHEVTVNSNQNPSGYDFGNFQPDPQITKSNDKPNASAGDTVTYTLHVTSNTGSTPMHDVTVTDLLPGGFSYVAGSTSILGATTVEPSVAGGTLTWTIDSLSAENPVTITYQAKIASDTVDGTYKNFASCKTFVGGQRILDEFQIDAFQIFPVVGGTEYDCNTADSTVNVGHGTSFGGNLVGQVLGASTELPATGSPTALLLVSLGLVGTGLFLKGYTEKKTKKVRAKRKTKRHAKK